MSLARLKARLERDRKLQMQGEILWAVTMGAFMMSVVDGEMSDEEYDALVHAINEISGSDGANEEQILDLLEANAALYDEIGFAGCTREIAARLTNPELREAAVTIAGTLAFLDGKITTQENAAFRMLANALGFTETEATKILESAMLEEP